MMFCPNGHCLCRTLQDLSTKTWNDLQDAEKYNSPMHEETITQNLALELNRRHNRETKVHIFKKHQETLNGSDWIWLFYDKNSGNEIRIAVQAKRLYPTGRYDAFKTDQPDKMLRYAQVVNAVPVFALYNYPKVRPSIYRYYEPRWMDFVYGMDHPRDYGVVLVHTKSVKSLGSGGNHPGRMLERACPWWLPTCNCGMAPFPTNSLEAFARKLSLLLGIERRFAGPSTSEMSGSMMSWLNGEADYQEALDEEFLNIDAIGGEWREDSGFRPSFILATELVGHME